MTTGIIVNYDPEEESGFILVDHTDDKVPFDTEAVEDFQEGEMLYAGQRVELRVEGGPVGVWATHVRRLPS